MITIGLRDIYDQQQNSNNLITALSAKLDSALISQTMAQQSIAQQFADLRHDLADHEARLRTQEAQRFVSPRAMWTGVGVIIGALGTIFTIVTALLPP